MAQNDIDLRINAAINLGNTAESLGDIKKSIKELNFAAVQYADTYPELAQKATAALGKIKDKMGDAAAATRSLSGSHLENLTGSLNLVKGSLSSLDFGSATTGIKNLNSSLKGLTFKELGAEVASFGSSLLSLGKMILTSPIFLIAAAIAALIQYFIGWDKVIKVITQTFKDFTDALGLTHYAEEEFTKKKLEGFDEEMKALEDKYDLEIQLATISLKNTGEIENKKRKEVLQTYNSNIEYLNQLKIKNGELTKDQEDQLNKTKQDRQKYLKSIFDAEVANALKIEQTTQSINDRIKTERINILNLNGDQSGALKASANLEVFKLLRAIKEEEAKKQPLLGSALDPKLANEKAVIENKLKELQDYINKAESIGAIITDKDIKRIDELFPGQNGGSGLASMLKYNASFSNTVNKVGIGMKAGITEKTINEFTQTDKERLAQIEGLKVPQTELNNIITKNNNGINNNIKGYNELISLIEKEYNIKKQTLATQNDTKNQDELLSSQEEYVRNVIGLYEKLKTKKEIVTPEEINTLSLGLNKSLTFTTDAFEKNKEKLQEIGGYIDKVNITTIENLKVSKEDFDLVMSKSTKDKLKAEQNEYDENLKNINNAYNQEIAAAINKGESLTEITKKYNKLLLQEEVAHANSKEQINKKESIKKIEMAQQVSNSLMSISTYISQFQVNEANGNQSKIAAAKKREFNRNKLFGSISATINTYQGITKALDDYPYPMSYIIAGLVGAMGFSQVAAINSQKFDENGSGTNAPIGAFSGNSSGSSGFSSPSSFSGPSVFNSGFSQQVPSGGPAFMRVAVVESDIRNVMARVDVLQTRATMFGP
jgi:hypothetical protein